MPARNHRLAVCLTVGAVCGLPIGCGASSSSDDSPSRSAVVASVESICSKGHARREHLFAAVALKAHTLKTQEAAILSSVVEPSAQVARELAALEAPGNLRSQLDRLVRTIEVENKNVEVRPVDAYHSQIGTYEETDELAQALGLDSCAEL